MLKADIPELKVLEYTQALQRTQNLESRGDLQNKGIYKFLITIYEWSEKFMSNKSLPGLDILEREIGIEEDKLKYFVMEYAIRNYPPLFRKLNYVNYSMSATGDSSHPSSHLKNFTVFCRPTFADGVSCVRYAIGLNDISMEAIKRWLTERRVLASKDVRRDSIYNSIDNNSLVDTYASTEIGSLFQCPFDKTKKTKDVTIVIHIKPILKKLVEDKLVFFIRNEKASQPGNRSVFYYYNKEEIFDRLDFYMDYVKEKIVPELVRIGVLNEPEEEDYFERKLLAETILSYMNDSYGDQKTVVEEILLLNDFYSQELKKVEEEKNRQNLEELIEHVRASGKILNLHTITLADGKISEEGRNYLLSNSNILYTEYADKSSYYEYILHRLNIQQAVESAVQQYKKTKLDSELTILRFMGAIEDLDNMSLVQNFEEVERQSLFSFLPFFTWLWRWLTGNKTVHKFEAEIIRNSLRQVIQNKIVAKRSIFLAQEKEKQEKKRKESEESNASKGRKKLVKSGVGTKNLESARKELMGSGGYDSFPKNNTPDNIDPNVAKRLEEIAKILNEAWDFGHYPDRVYIMEKMGSTISEDDLVNFIKRNGGRDIYSFMIRNQTEKYPFPILVTRDYLKKNGSKLLAEVEKVLEKQKFASIPNQSQFDFAVSMAEFLDRILPKIK